MTSQPLSPSTGEALRKADELRDSDPAAAESSYQAILSKDASAFPPTPHGKASLTPGDESELKAQESALMSLGKLYRDNK